MPLVLAGLPAVGAGLAALILLFGAILIADLLLKAIDVTRIPGFIGDFLRSMAHGIATAVNWISSLFAAIARPALSVFVAPAAGFINTMNRIVVATARFGSWIRWLVHTAVPQLWTGLLSSIASAVSNLTALAARLFQQAVTFTSQVRDALVNLVHAAAATVSAYALTLHRLLSVALNQGFASLAAYSQSLFRLAMGTLAAQVASLTTHLLATRAQLAAYANQLAQWAVHTATGISIDWARKYTDQLIDLYNKAIAGGTAIAMAPSWPTALSAIDSISLALPDSVAAVLARIGAIPRIIPRDIATEVGAIAAVSTVAIDWVARCGVSLCRNAKGFGDDLAALEDAALLLAIFELVTAGVEDPNGAGKAVHDDIMEPLSAVVSEFADMVGLRG